MINTLSKLKVVIAICGIGLALILPASASQSLGATLSPNDVNTINADGLCGVGSAEGMWPTSPDELTTFVRAAYTIEARWVEATGAAQCQGVDCAAFIEPAHVLTLTQRAFIPMIVAGESYLLWSQPSTWGGTLPQAGDAVHIPAGKRVLLDINPPPLHSLTIDGELAFKQQDLDLTMGWILINPTGSLRIGSAYAPFQHRATITLTDSDMNRNVLGMGTRGILVNGGTLEMHGASPTPAWTKLNAHAMSGTQALSLLHSVNWQPGQRVVIAPTDYYGVAQTELHTTSSVSGQQITLSAPLQRFRWGVMQYVSTTGLVLTPTFSVTPLAIDQRAEVGNLSRKIIIQGANDLLWQNHQFGAQVMIANGGTARIDGVELTRVGQGGRLGRYPIHYHELSYNSAGAWITDVSGQYVKNSSIWNSSNRCIVIHGTNGLWVKNNLCYDIAGHAVFVEDAVERRNIIEDNLVLRVRQPISPVIDSDIVRFRRGPSGFWLTNPDNIVRGNVAADAEGNGFWLAFPAQPLGSHKSVPIRPSNVRLGEFANNTAHSNMRPGVNLDFAPFNDAGQTQERKYIPTVDEQVDQYTNRVRFTLSDIQVYKNNDNGLWNRVSWPDYIRFVSSDNAGKFFAGAGDDGDIKDSLIVGQSLNNLSPIPSSDPQTAVASYHSTFDIFNNVFVNFALVPTQPTKASGVFATDDYYTNPVDKGLIRNPTNTLINASPGLRVRSPNINTPVGNAALAGALWDPHGYWGPAGRYWVYDVPFLTHGLTCTPVMPAGQNGQSCVGPYYGVGMFVIDGSNRYQPRHPIRAQRLNTSNTVVGEWIVNEGSGSGTNTFGIMPWMRHFAAVKAGRYRLDFTDGISTVLPLNDVALSLENMLTTTDYLVLGVRFAGSGPLQVYLSTEHNYDSTAPGSPYRRNLSAVSSFSSVVSATSDVFWHDTANGRVWVRVSGGLAAPDESSWLPNSDQALYRTTYLRIYRP